MGSLPGTADSRVWFALSNGPTSHCKMRLAQGFFSFQKWYLVGVTVKSLLKGPLLVFCAACQILTLLIVPLVNKSFVVVSGVNYCLNSSCSHLCLLKPQGYSCNCPVGMVLQDDNITCLGKGLDIFICSLCKLSCLAALFV